MLKRKIEIDNSTRHQVFKSSFILLTIWISICGLILSVFLSYGIIFLNIEVACIGFVIIIPILIPLFTVTTKYSDNEKNILQKQGSKLGFIHALLIFIIEFGLCLFIISIFSQRMLWIISISTLCVIVFIILEKLFINKYLKIYNDIEEKN